MGGINDRGTGDRQYRQEDDPMGKFLKWLPVISLLVLGGIAWGTVEAGQKTQNKDISENKDAIVAQQKQMKQTHDKVLIIEERQKVVQEKLKEVGRDVKDILSAISRNRTEQLPINTELCNFYADTL